MTKLNENRYIQEIEKCNKQINDHLNEISFLKEVHLGLTKEGKEYSSLVKAFKFDNKEWTGLVSRDKEFDCYVLQGVNKNTGCYTPQIRIYDYIQLNMNYATRTYDAPEGIEESRIIRDTWRVPYYYKNTQELAQSISDAIESREEWVRNLRVKLEVLPKLKSCLEECLDKIDALDNQEPNLYLSYLMKELI